MHENVQRRSMSNNNNNQQTTSIENGIPNVGSIVRNSIVYSLGLK